MKDEELLVRWAVEIQSLAQAGLTYGRDRYDLERYERLRDIAAEMIARKADVSFARARELFCSETGYQTPKLDTRAAVFRDGRILLVRENNGTWTLPGGWCDVDQSVGANAVKETREEAGIDVRPVRLIAVEDRKLHNRPLYAYGVTKVFVLCEYLGGAFRENAETTECAFFAADALPEPLAAEKATAEQIRMCFDAAAADVWETRFD